MTDDERPDLPGAPPTSDPPRPDYKGAPLDPERGPGLGCFWLQTIAFLILFVLTPFGVINGWPAWLTTAMLIMTLVLLLFVGQTIIFLLRLVSADRRARRRPLRAGASPTVGDLATQEPGAPDASTPNDEPGSPAAPGADGADGSSAPPSVRQ